MMKNVSINKLLLLVDESEEMNEVFANVVKRKDYNSTRLSSIETYEHMDMI